MPALLLTPGNIRALKAELAQLLPTAKSSHRTEALAAGLGFRTHAALLASMQGDAITRPLFVGFDPNQVSQRLIAFGQYQPSNAFAHLTRAPAMADLPWLALQNGAKADKDRWFFECRRRFIPFMYIETRRKFSRLEWDCITIHPDEEQHVRDRAGSELGRSMFKTFQDLSQSARGRPFYDASSFVGHVDGLEPDLACEMADAFFRMLYDPLRGSVQASAA